MEVRRNAEADGLGPWAGSRAQRTKHPLKGTGLFGRGGSSAASGGGQSRRVDGRAVRDAKRASPPVGVACGWQPSAADKHRSGPQLETYFRHRLLWAFA